MRKCLYSRSNRNEKLFCLVGFLVSGAYNIVHSLITFLIDLKWILLEDILAYMLWFFLGIGIVVLGVFLYTTQNGSYFLNAKGIAVTYSKFNMVKILWSNVAYISVCDVHHTANNWMRFDIVIRIVNGEEKIGPFIPNSPLTLSGLERWRTMGYEIIHRNNVIIIEYSPERLAEIKEISGKDVFFFLTDKAKKRAWYEDENGDHHLLNTN